MAMSFVGSGCEASCSVKNFDNDAKQSNNSKNFTIDSILSNETSSRSGLQNGVGNSQVINGNSFSFDLAHGLLQNGMMCDSKKKCDSAGKQCVNENEVPTEENPYSTIEGKISF